jgi:hypothetical protein
MRSLSRSSLPYTSRRRTGDRACISSPRPKKLLFCATSYTTPASREQASKHMEMNPELIPGISVGIPIPTGQASESLFRRSLPDSSHRLAQESVIKLWLDRRSKWFSLRKSNSTLKGCPLLFRHSLPDTFVILACSVILSDRRERRISLLDCNLLLEDEILRRFAPQNDNFRKSVR